jgi:catechol 2,3-dioxygenase-like lactoylglutathione lyase family enzyme
MDDFKLTQINMVLLGVEKLDRALPFYCDQLGLSLRNRMEGFAFLDAGAITLVLSEPLARSRQPKNGAIEVVFPVQHVREAHAALLSKGVNFIVEPRNVSGPFWAANFLDPDGHLFSIFGNE